MNGEKFYIAHPVIETSTISGKAASKINDVRGKAVVFDSAGAIALASDPSAPILGIALMTSGVTNAASGNGAVQAGEDIDIQIADTGYASAGAAIKAGDALTTDANGDLVPASSGDYVVATALNFSAKGAAVYVQITKYAIPAAASEESGDSEESDSNG